MAIVSRAVAGQFRLRAAEIAVLANAALLGGTEGDSWRSIAKAFESSWVEYQQVLYPWLPRLATSAEAAQEAYRRHYGDINDPAVRQKLMDGLAEYDRRAAEAAAEQRQPSPPTAAEQQVRERVRGY